MHPTVGSRKLALIVALSMAGSGHPALADTGPLICEPLQFAVSLVDGQPPTDSISASLCSRGNVAHRTIQVLLHGGTYDHNYWDFPLDPGRYSYVQALTRAGYATLNLDRLGSGQSSHPDGNALTLHTNAVAIHQVVQALRSGSMAVGALGSLTDNRIMLVGHSLGSFIASIEASAYHDVDALILSGYSHVTGPGTAVVFASVYPAMFDPKFATSGLPLSYLTTMPGTRGADFYSLPNADPTVVAEDEVLKQTATVGEVSDVQNALGASMGITVPVLIADGDFDTLSCNAPSCSQSHSLATEASNFPNPRQVQVAIIPSSGHDVNLHRDAPVWFLIAQVWSDAVVGPGPAH